MNKRVIKYFIDVIYLSFIICLAAIIKTFLRRRIYLVGERKDQCQDNGYHLFKYVRENYPKDKFYYVIDKDSPQLLKIKDLGNVVYFKSFKHYFYYFIAKKLVCAHVSSCTPDNPIIWWLEEKNIIKKNRVFIQHGITKEIIPSLMFNYSSINTFICGAKPEYDFVTSNFNYPKNSVHYLGFCRFDALHEIKTKKQILLMPTWRQWFGMNGINRMSLEKFLKSNYFTTYNQLINNEKLIKLLENSKYDLIFYLHHEMQCYRECFSSKSQHIKIAIDHKYEVQDLLKQSEILITDYSSIAFDFAYMRKPLIYFQFDSKDYYANHYEKGYFDYEMHGFGKVTYFEEDLLEELEALLSSKRKTKYLKRIESFFPLYDENNCERTYKEVIQ